jgi:hypothetical protein
MGPLLILMALARVGGGGQGDIQKTDVACVAVAHAEPRIFVETTGAVLPKPREGDWRELGNEAERKALADGAQPPNTEAIVRSGKAATLVSMYFQDKSGAWSHVVDYCFRSDGSLARLKGTFNSLAAGIAGHAGVRRRRTTTFDAANAVVKTESRLFDIDSDRPLGDVSFSDAVAAKLEPGGVVSTVKEHLPAIKACYEHALKRAPSVAGKIVARFSIDDGGKVGAFAWQGDQLHSAAFNICARHVVETLRFAPAKKGDPVTVTFPFVFETADAKVTLQPPASNDQTAAR